MSTDQGQGLLQIRTNEDCIKLMHLGTLHPEQFHTTMYATHVHAYVRTYVHVTACSNCKLSF